MSKARGTTNLSFTVASPADVAVVVALEIADLIRRSTRADGSAVLGLATGHTPIGVYRELVRLHQEESLDFAGVVTFNLDEYVGLASDHPCSFRRFMDEHLFRHVNLSPDRIHFLQGGVDAADAAARCADYERAITAAGGIDLQLLGLGRTGHIGFNEPGSTRDSRTRVVELAGGTRADNQRAFAGHGEVPARALTMGVATILEARCLRVLAFGKHKQDVVRRTLVDPVSAATPSTFLRLHADARLWTDADAATGVPGVARPPR